MVVPGGSHGLQWAKGCLQESGTSSEAPGWLRVGRRAFGSARSAALAAEPAKFTWGGVGTDSTQLESVSSLQIW